MCRVSFNYDADKRDMVKAKLAKEDINLSDSLRLYLDVLASDKAEELEAYLVKKKVESDPEDTVYRFDDAEEAMKFLDYATR